MRYTAGINSFIYAFTPSNGRFVSSADNTVVIRAFKCTVLHEIYSSKCSTSIFAVVTNIRLVQIKICVNNMSMIFSFKCSMSEGTGKQVSQL